jgi:phage tail-like protein
MENSSMARSIATDFLRNSKFRVSIISPLGVGGVPTETLGINEGGFATCTMPQMTIEQATYKSGLDTYTKKYPGNPSVNDISMTRGAVRLASALHKWILASNQGKEYRCDVRIEQYHLDELDTNLATAPGAIADPGFDAASKPARRSYVLYNAFCFDHKPSSDQDSNSSDISMEEIQVCFESYDVLENGTAITV